MSSNSSTNQNGMTPSMKDEMDFRLSLLRLMTVPHEGSTGVSPSTACQQVEELSMVLVRKRQPEDRRPR